MSDADWATEQYAPCLCGHQQRNCTCHVAKPSLTYELGLRDAALESGARPVALFDGRRICINCGERARLDDDGWCRPCSGGAA